MIAGLRRCRRRFVRRAGRRPEVGAVACATNGRLRHTTGICRTPGLSGRRPIVEWRFFALQRGSAKHVDGESQMCADHFIGWYRAASRGPLYKAVVNAIDWFTSWPGAEVRI